VAAVAVVAMATAAVVVAKWWRNAPKPPDPTCLSGTGAEPTIGGTYLQECFFTGMRAKHCSARCLQLVVEVTLEI
jgi:hypothetical protein